ncbi:MAG: hypothetical protein H6618_08705 [Deltaproteobacteria bacterium]|nr:hypothetical protein [Deltaproteobacteria bacterium]
MRGLVLSLFFLLVSEIAHAGKIVISRKDRWFGCAQAFEVYIDGKRVGDVANGKESTYTVSDGTYKLKIRAIGFGKLSGLVRVNGEYRVTMETDWAVLRSSESSLKFTKENVVFGVAKAFWGFLD